MFKNIKLRNSLIWWLKVLVFLSVLVVFARRLGKIEFSSFTEITIQHYGWLFLVILLFFINWGLELLKWNEILKKSEVDNSLSLVFKSLIAGITTEIITPNRIGNFIGRMLFFKGKVRAQIVLGTLYGNFAQFLATIICGSIGLMFLPETLLEEYNAKIILLILTLTLLSLTFYISVPYFPWTQTRFFRKKNRLLLNFQSASLSLMPFLLILSILRYFTFLMQYLLLFMTFGIPPSLELTTGISILFLVSTLIPNIFIGKLIVNGTVSLFTLSHFVPNEALIVVVSVLIWVLNLAVPSLIGVIFIFKQKIALND